MKKNYGKLESYTCQHDTTLIKIRARKVVYFKEEGFTNQFYTTRHVVPDLGVKLGKQTNRRTNRSTNISKHTSTHAVNARCDCNATVDVLSVNFI